MWKVFSKRKIQMRFTIPCKTFARLAIIPYDFTEDVTDEAKAKLRCVRLEHYKGNTFAIAANQKIAAIELIGKTNEPDGAAHVVIDSPLIDACNTALDILEVVSIPEFKIGTAKTLYGYQHVGNACIYPETTIMDDWRKWGPSKPAKKSNGVLFLNLNYIETLNQSSPSGRLMFPEFIDVSQTLVLRDADDPHWVGLLTPRPASGKGEAIGAVLPDWWN
jgi:hypothetical protein